MQSAFNDTHTLAIYGSDGNPYGPTMVGGADVVAINAMLQNAFDSGLTDNAAPVVKIGTYKGRTVYEQKAADQIRISLDPVSHKAYVKLIIRKTDPGLGFMALAGGFKEAQETDVQTANREETEEAKGKSGQLIAKHNIPRHPVLGDVRVWGGADRADGVKKGDIFAMSTAALIPVVNNAHGFVEAGDDAASAGWVSLADLTDANLFGIKGHARMLLEATKLASLTHMLPASFAQTLHARSEDIRFGDGQMENLFLMRLSEMLITKLDRSKNGRGYAYILG